MRALVVGLGVQGRKRRAIAGAECIGAVDPQVAEAQWRDLAEVPPDSYDAALVCLPDAPKVEVLRRLLGQGKHVLVEKPLWAAEEREIAALEDLARQTGAVCYTAYNHRFEPHFVRMADLVASGALGEVYSCRLFYGNGTARLVRDSAWRDEGGGVIPDLCSHLLDSFQFWFGARREDWRVVAAERFENRAPDHALIVSEGAGPRLAMEVTLLSWRNHFTCDLFAEKGSAHIESLCKWGPSRFVHRRRVLPSGRPPEQAVTLVQEDPTWALEYAHFKDLVARGQTTDLGKDRWLNRTLRSLSERQR